MGSFITIYFIMYFMEYLSWYVQFMSNIPRYDVGKIAKEASKIPYLIFVDDWLIFCKYKRQTFRKTREILKKLKEGFRTINKPSQIFNSILFSNWIWTQGWKTIILNDNSSKSIETLLRCQDSHNELAKGISIILWSK